MFLWIQRGTHSSIHSMTVVWFLHGRLRTEVLYRSIHSLASFLFWCISYCAAGGCHEHISFSIEVVSFRRLWWHLMENHGICKRVNIALSVCPIYIGSFFFFFFFWRNKREKDLILPLGICPCFWQEINSHSFGFYSHQLFLQGNSYWLIFTNLSKWERTVCEDRSLGLGWVDNIWLDNKKSN